MIAKQLLTTTVKLFEIPKHVVARAIMGLFMILVGISYLYSSYSGNVEQSADLMRFSSYGPEAPEVIAWLYIICGSLMIFFIQHDFVVRVIFPNYLYVGMLFQLAVTKQASWTALFTTLGLMIIATIAIMRGVPSADDEKGARK